MDLSKALALDQAAEAENDSFPLQAIVSFQALLYFLAEPRRAFLHPRIDKPQLFCQGRIKSDHLLGQIAIGANYVFSPAQD